MAWCASRATIVTFATSPWLQATADPAVVDGRYELRVDTDVFTVDGTSGSVRVRRGTADRPHAALTTDAGTLHAVALGHRPIADAVESGDLRLDGDPQAISGLTGLLQALSGAAGRVTADAGPPLTRQA